MNIAARRPTKGPRFLMMAFLGQAGILVECWRFRGSGDSLYIGVFGEVEASVYVGVFGVITPMSREFSWASAFLRSWSKPAFMGLITVNRISADTTGAPGHPVKKLDARESYSEHTKRVIVNIARFVREL